MDRRIEKLKAQPRSYLAGVFWLLMLVALLIGLLGLFVSAAWQSQSQPELREDVIKEISSTLHDLTYKDSETIRQTLNKWEERTSQERFWPTLVRDLSIALLIAVFLTVSIELYAGRRLREQVATEVLSGVFNKIIPEVIFDEVKSNVIQAPVMRKNWEIRMSLARDAALTDPNLYVSTTILGYGIQNLLNRSQVYPLSSRLSQDVTGPDAQGEPLPRFVRVTINGVAVPDLSRHLSDNASRLLVPVPLPGSSDEVVQILLEVREIIRIPDAIYWATPTGAEGAIIEIDNTGTPDLGFKVEAYHPDKGRLRETIAGRRWVFTGGILPWQAFEIQTFRRA